MNSDIWSAIMSLLLSQGLISDPYYCFHVRTKVCTTTFLKFSEFNVSEFMLAFNSHTFLKRAPYY